MTRRPRGFVLEASGEAPRPTSGRRAVRAPDGLGGGTNHHPHQWLRRREIRASASVGGDRGPQVGPALAAEITPATNVSPEFLGRVTPSAGFAERDRMMPAFREEQRPQSNEQQHGMHRRPQARTCQDPSAKKVLWKAVDWGRQHLIRTPCPPILVDSSARPGEHGWLALTRATRGLEHHQPAGQVDRVARAGRRGRLLLVTLEAARVDADLPVLGGVVAPCIPPVLRWAAD